MLSKEENELLTNTNRGTPMGELFRRFWLPIAESHDLGGPDGSPFKVQVLGEELIAYRDSQGRPGLVDAFCPHRGAPLYFGRNEESGLRCVYHGWKFDVTGECVDMPSAPEAETYRPKVTIKAYPCLEAGDVIWAYMGPPDKKPPFPLFDWTRVPSENRIMRKFKVQCNYLQSMEGDFDTAHLRYLHSTLEGAIPNPLNPNGVQGTPGGGPGAQAGGIVGEPFPVAVGNRRITRRDATQMEDTPSGTVGVTVREAPDGGVIAAIGYMLMLPVFCTVGLAGPNTASSNIRIPIDNETIMFFRLRWSYDPFAENMVHEYRDGENYNPRLIPGTITPELNKENEYGLDREAQRERSYTGIRSFPIQDIAMVENQWGRIADRSQEHLMSMDYQIIHNRERLLKAAKALANGTEPSEPWHPEAYCYRSAFATAATAEEAIAEAKKKAFEQRFPIAAEAIPTS
jgi:nitrite reductase/ring-hydroxylating ferredoxin subunit